ncbi:hypothetical protein SAMN05216192_11279 [Paenibacillus typhae]|uniref:Major Facilitator Superfamily protein n=2 Tax=Paenibacillus typhae TaxID=1174501 RepID=A0A1G8REH9_9BACL|nr:hypothetical protein SAMN05216192_11279 [Paenibacillus typhae]
MADYCRTDTAGLFRSGDFGGRISYIQDLLPDLPGYALTLYTNASTLGRLFGSLAGGAAALLLGYRHAYWGCLLLLISAFVLMIPQSTSFSAG